jgi:hypothetical protein
MSVRFMLSVERQPPSGNADALCGSTGTLGFHFRLSGPTRVLRQLLQLLDLLKRFITIKLVGVRIVSFSTPQLPREGSSAPSVGAEAKAARRVFFLITTSV